MIVSHGVHETRNRYLESHVLCHFVPAPYIVGVEQWCVVLPFLRQARPSIRLGRPTGNKALRRVVADGDRTEPRGTAR